MTDLTILTKPDCHLCDVAREIVEQTLADLPDDVADAVEVTEVSILDDDALYAQWWEKIPVVLIDGKLHGHWRVAPDRLRNALVGAAKESA
ncbi:glutaredoxin family protein [Microbacterium sp. Marseille-Q6965]|uniref:glutaredoxin family protein n=1 Tax=Microbacterium sp. Marseille-Q6965 TaxID=2965072 RepID=UPI0021B7981E|nr:glutaredoxin family protein [Microbacterium sp. Marseille-Q6965]